MSVISTWGSTPAERAAHRVPCSALVGANGHYWRAIDVDAPSAMVYRWICQLTQAPYSYDRIDNFGRRSPQQLTPGADDLRVGQHVMMIFELVAFTPGEEIMLVSARAFLDAKPRPARWFVPSAIRYRVVSAGRARSRIVVAMTIAYPRGPIGWLWRAFLPLGDLVMMRRQLLNLKRLAERDAAMF